MFIYTMCGVYFAISTLKKVSKRHFTCRFYLSTIAPATRYLKTTSPDGMPVSYRSLSEHQRMHFRHVPSCPPRRLSPRFPRRFLADYPFPRLPAVHADFITFVPRSFRLLGTSIAPPKRCRPRQTGSRQPISHPMHIAFGRRIILRNHIASRHPFRIAARYCGGSIVSSHGSAKGGEDKHGMPVRSVSARLQMVLVGYARCRTVCPFPQVIGAADTRY